MKVEKQKQKKKPKKGPKELEMREATLKYIIAIEAK